MLKDNIVAGVGVCLVGIIWPIAQLTRYLPSCDPAYGNYIAKFSTGAIEVAIGKTINLERLIEKGNKIIDNAQKEYISKTS